MTTETKPIWSLRAMRPDGQTMKTVIACSLFLLCGCCQQSAPLNPLPELNEAITRLEELADRLEAVQTSTTTIESDGRHIIITSELSRGGIRNRQAVRITQ